MTEEKPGISMSVKQVGKVGTMTISEKKAIQQAELACKEMASEIEGEGCEVFVTLPRWALAKLLGLALCELARRRGEKTLNEEPPD